MQLNFLKISLLTVLYLCFAYTEEPCHYFQDVDVTRDYEIFSPGFDEIYPRNVTCTWIARAPAGYNIHLDCFSVHLPTSPNCLGDRIEVSQRGRPDLLDARRICGRGEFNHLTTSNTLAMKFISTPKSPGGKFFCSMQAITDFCQCGRKPFGRIVGGMPTQVNEFPWMAGIVDLSTTNDVYCGATLIHVRYFLTAGHCIVRRRIRDIAMLVGDDDTSTGADTPFARLYQISQVTLHPKYKANGIENDIAVIKTFNEVQLNEGVGVVCLPFKYKQESNTFVRDKVTVTGWGTLEFSGPKSDKLMKVDLDVISNAECNTKGMNVTSGHLCTYTRGKDSCQFDSGGPITYEDPENVRHFLVGIVSRGSACASKAPSINVRVTDYLDWIVDVTREVTYCNK